MMHGQQNVKFAFVVRTRGRRKKLGKTTKRQTRTHLVLKPHVNGPNKRHKQEAKTTVDLKDVRYGNVSQLGWSGWGQDPGPRSCEHSTKPSGFIRRTLVSAITGI
jgi:hypothetical protein